MAGQGTRPLPSLTEGSIRRGIWLLAWPAVLQMSIVSANGLIDTYFIGQLHLAAALAAVGMANQIGWLVMSLMSSVNVGTTALVARFTGARSDKDVHETIVQSLTLAVAGSALIMLIIFAGMKPIVGLLSEDLVVRSQAMSYLKITIASIFPFFAFMTATSIFRGLGDTVTPLRIIGVTTVVKIVGDYVLIFGIGPFPRMEVVGAATATALSQTVGMIVAAIILLRSPVGHALRGSWRPKLDWMARILKIGSPAAVQNVVRSGGSWVFFGILAQAAHATATQAALIIGLQLEGLAFMPGFGFNIAAATLVGQNLGARKPDRAERSAWGAAALGAAMMSAIALFFFIYADWLASHFTTDPMVRRYAALYLRINAISEPFLALSMVLTGAFEGAGDTVPPTVITIGTLWFLRLPVAYLLVVHLGYGAVGAWTAMAASASLQGILIALMFKRNKWKNKKV